MQKILKFILSMQFAGFLLLLYGAALGSATILETNFDTEFARITVYNSLWLEVVYLLSIISLVGNYIHLKLYKRAKWSVGLFHISFVLMIIGGAATRYIGEEGMMHIREGEESNKMLSSKSYLSLYVAPEGEGVTQVDEKSLPISNYLDPNCSVAVSGVSVTTKSVQFSSDGNGSKLIVSVDSGDETQELSLPFKKGIEMQPKVVVIGGAQITVGYGQKVVSLPFSLKLREFVLIKYPASNSPSSYESLVTLIDKDQSVSRDERIYMNNVLDYRGYRFFQSSYDPDEKGTVLSVNRDGIGTWITYLSYILMTIGMLFSLFHSRTYLVKRYKSISAVKPTLILLFVLMGSFVSKGAVSKESVSIQDKKFSVVNKGVADRFGKIYVQGGDGRIEPMSTYSGEVLRKVFGKDRVEDIYSERVVLSMITFPKEWKDAPIIKVGNKELATTIGIKGEKYCSFNDLFTKESGYKIYEEVQACYKKSTSEHNMFEKEIMKVDERVNVLYALYTQSLFPIFPDISEPDKEWISPANIEKNSSDAKSLFMKNSLPLLGSALADNNLKDANSYLGGVEKLQLKFGKNKLPSERLVKLEIAYNRASVFKRIFPFYMVIGIVLFAFFFWSLLRGREVSSKISNASLALLMGIFILHTIGLIIRGVVAKHMPWSDGYESMLYVAWTGMLAGFIFARKNILVLSAAALLSGIFLLVAHLSWMNPEITNLVPVLKSYWLTFHVAIITASYGFLGLSSILGLFNMILMISIKKSNRELLNQSIERLTAVNEIALIIGLYMLTIGTFLGGVWANESWGRYWGWDPKETWSLVTVIVYTFVSHMRFIPSLKDRFSYNFASCIGFSTVIMTYLGVNYYLSGLHSYGASEAGSAPMVVMAAAIIVAVIAIWANIKESSSSNSSENL